MNGIALLVLAAGCAGFIIGRLTAGRGEVDVPAEFHYRATDV